MQRNTALTWSWLGCLTTKRYDALLETYGDFDTALANLDEELCKKMGLRDEGMYHVLTRLEEFDPERYEAELSKRGLSFCCREDDEYPAALKEIADPPSFLYWKGDLSLLNQPSIGLVGAREMTEYGARVVERFVPRFVQAGLVTVSGLARGIDAHVATETLAANGKTVAVLGHGLAMVYPKSNERIAKQIIEAGGLILSEFPLDTSPDKHTFPARNRIVAGLSLGTVVLEAAEGSGALITADLALDYGREVFAVPGQIFDPNYAGCHEILSKGLAKLVVDPGQVLSEIGIVASQHENTPPQLSETSSSEEHSLFECLTTMPQETDKLVERSGLVASQVNATLTMLELQGVVKNVGGGRWVRL